MFFYLFSSFSVLVFLVFSSFWVFQPKNIFLKKILFWKISVFTKNIVLNFFWREIVWTIFLAQNLSFEISSKKKEHFSPKQNLFLFSHASTSAHTLEGSLDRCCVAWRFWASVVSCVFCCHWSRPWDIRCIKPSLFFLNKQPLCFFQLFLFWFLCFNCSSIFPWQKITFYSFRLLVFILMFPVHFFSPHVLSRGSDGTGQNTSSREMSEGSGGNRHPDLKRRSLVGVILSMTEGLSWWTRINRGECVGWWFFGKICQQ